MSRPADSGMYAPTETALIVELPEVERVVGSFRAQHDPAAAEGVPAHMTVLYPFLPPSRISATVVRSLEGLFSAFPSFRAEFAEIGRFPGVLYLAPVMDARFRRLTECAVALYPETPPYGGQFQHLMPHLTVAHAEDSTRPADIAARFEASTRGEIPIRATVRDVALIEKRNGRWRPWMRFPLDVDAGRDGSFRGSGAWLSGKGARRAVAAVGPGPG